MVCKVENSDVNGELLIRDSEGCGEFKGHSPVCGDIALLNSEWTRTPMVRVMV